MSRSFADATKIVSAFNTNKILHVSSGEGEGTSTMVEIDTEICATDNALEILSYLPAKKLQTFQTVCRDWHQLISSPYFVRLHLSRAIRSRVVVTQYYPGPLMIEYNNYDHQKEVRHRVSIPPQFSKWPKILGSADGLILMRKDFREVNVFNPSTGKYRVVCLSPPYNLWSKCSWFGNLADGEYTFVMVSFSIIMRHDEIWVYKFTPGSDVMNRIHCTPISIGDHLFRPLQDFGTLVQGVVYWPITNQRHTDFPSSKDKILGYRLHENKQVLISAPPGARYGCLGLGLFVDGCSLFATSYKIKSVVKLWIMKGGRPWTKYANIEIGNFNTIHPLGFFPDGDFIVDVDHNRLVKYSLNRKNLKSKSTILMQHGLYSEYRVIMCADTLVSP